MKRLMILFMSAILVCGLYAETPHPLAGHWEGAIKLQPEMQLEVRIDLAIDETSKWKGTIDIPAPGAKGLPLINVSLQDSRVGFEIENVPGKPSFSGELSADSNKIAGNFTQAGQTFPFELERKAAPASKAGKTDDEILKELRELIKVEMEQWHVPGLGLAIIKDGKILTLEGFGVRDLKSGQPVTADTLFAIGSSTKSFTATSLGITIAEGKARWDEPVKKYLPGFELKDEFASERMTPLDLLTHQSGLPRHDLVWYNNQFTREQLFQRLKYLSPNEDFREIFQYQNLMFMTAGYLAGQLQGKPWEDVVREKIFQPLQMNASNFSVIESQKTADYALPVNMKKIKKQKTKKES